MADDRALEETRPSGLGRARGLVSSRVSGARVQARTYAPPEDLADAVESLWVGAWDLRGQPPHVSELIGDPAVHLVFEAGAGRIVGVWTRLWTRRLEGVGEVRAAKLRPGAACAFLPGAASDYSDRLTPLSEVSGDAGALAEAVLGPADERAGLEALSGWLRGRRRRDARVQRAIRLAAQIRSGGVTRVDELAAEAGLTVRGVQRLFRAHVGAPPKWVIRWSRLQEVAARVEAGEAPDLAALAFELGYADQAHLARDFRATTGRTLRGFEDAVWR